MKNFLLTIVIVLAVLSCKSKQTGFYTQKSKTFVDTLLVVDSLSFLQRGSFGRLTTETAQSAVKEYFDKLGYYKTEDSASVDWENDILICASFDTLYHVHLNADKYVDGLVTYYDIPCFSSSHCYQPHLAIVTFIDGKYRLISRDLLPDNYTIDSITQDRKFTYIHGNVYDCGEHEFTRGFRARIRRD